MQRIIFFGVAFGLFVGANLALAAEDLGSLPVYLVEESAPGRDWLVEEIGASAGVYRDSESQEIILSNGLIRRVFRIVPNAATVAFDNLMTGESMLRAVRPEARVVIDGKFFDVGGLLGQPNHAFVLPEWLDAMTADRLAMQFTGFAVETPKARMDWARVRHHAPDVAWPPKGVGLRLDFQMPDGKRQGCVVSVHYELYDGVPVLAKWLSIRNDGDKAFKVDRFTSEILAAVEWGSHVESGGKPFPVPNIHVETDYAFHGTGVVDSSRFSVRWKVDPEFKSQVNYALQTPCLLEVAPEHGPAKTLAPGETLETFHTFELPFDGWDRERNGLALRRMYKTIAPWATENPLMMHVRFADWDAVKTAIDQCEAVGFEMVILTFGSGFNVENESDKYRAMMQKYSAYAKSKGIEIGGYSLLASRSIDKKNDVIMPEGQSPAFGKSPCIQSEWGARYFDNLYDFYTNSGFNLLEHDGSYPGDVCKSKKHPGHEGLADSRWSQWRTITDFYKWCRATGVYLNVPDFYFLSGSNKTGMGYREVNWSLPRAQQVIHTRQNIFDGTWEKRPSMGWMFVPLTEYHGGGEAATIEPLDEHLDHYERMLVSNLALGVQACYRGPRLFDTDATQAMVKQWVDWFKKYRAILESDVVHGRRADGRDLDWMLHVNPTLKEKGLLTVFNPLEEEITRNLRVNLYYTGLKDAARIRVGEGPAQDYTLSRDYTVDLPVTVPPQGFAWIVIE